MRKNSQPTTRIKQSKISFMQNVPVGTQKLSGGADSSLLFAPLVNKQTGTNFQ